MLFSHSISFISISHPCSTTPPSPPQKTHMFPFLSSSKPLALLMYTQREKGKREVRGGGRFLSIGA